mmetsp:Transcript_41121/g.102298  ORF Transcript_41121/g.102298 Transcript_41121/m.102298 type:complete len:330 (+) Transcript_41121:1255-2244(+)
MQRLVGELHEVARVPLLLVVGVHPLLPLPWRLPAPRRLVGDLELCLPDVLQLGERLVHREDRVVDEHVDEADELGRVARELDHRGLVLGVRPEVLEDLVHLVAVLVLVVRPRVRAGELNVDKELHHRGGEEPLRERVGVKDDRQPVGDVAAVAVVGARDEEAEELRERRAEVWVLHVLGRADECDDQSDEVVQLVGAHQLEDLRRQVGEALEELRDVVHRVLGKCGEDAGDLRGERQSLGRRLGGRDEPSGNQPVEPHTRREHDRVAQLRLVAQDIPLHALRVLLEATDLRFEHLHPHASCRALPHQLILSQLQLLLQPGVLLHQLLHH